jgi:hypothetical protein
MTTHFNQILNKGDSPPHQICGEPFLHIAPYGPWQFARVQNATSFFLELRGRKLFVR